MSFHVKRSETARQTELTLHKGAQTTLWLPPDAHRSVREQNTYPNPGAYKHVPEDQNPLRPPPHWHWYQEEYFTVMQGRFIFTLEGKEIPVTAKDPQPVVIPPKARHTFKPDPDCTEACKLEIATASSPLVNEQTTDDDTGISERFFRNIYGYLNDCNAQKVRVSLPQILLFLHSAEVSVALPGPGWLARPLSYTLGLVLGKWVGEYLLGYKQSYPEYYDPSVASRKLK